MDDGFFICDAISASSVVVMSHTSASHKLGSSKADTTRMRHDQVVKSSSQGKAGTHNASRIQYSDSGNMTQQICMK